MYFVDSVNVLLRRWYVVLAGGLLMAAGAAAVFAYVPTAYQASGQMILLLPPTASDTNKPVNPYLNLQAGLTTTASLVSGSVTTKDVERQLAKEGFDSDYAVAVVPGTGPLVTVTAKDTDPALAVATRDRVMELFAADLVKIQVDAQVPQNQFMTVTSSNVSRGAEALPGSKLRALAGVAALGTILTLGAAFGVDRWRTRRRPRTGRRTAQDTDKEVEDEERDPTPWAVPIKRSAHPKRDRGRAASESSESSEQSQEQRRTGSGG